MGTHFDILQRLKRSPLKAYVFPSCERSQKVRLDFGSILFYQIPTCLPLPFLCVDILIHVCRLSLSLDNSEGNAPLVTTVVVWLPSSCSFLLVLFVFSPFFPILSFSQTVYIGTSHSILLRQLYHINHQLI